mmetsp:Transcript_17034/g.43640  ORF Transcript_17034/g.43640 Transcript_17034/m.43640 type:complete len:129 (+) Transcript_17034:879-1265(+)|eukprot:CAMPEP_0179988500 /NCGR_PEP_ID=MMETSP0984-20121128/3328_1 /TAXON_ID=483367 /ORGANISM="non described non described, Strain CCMP 2436" /LENGTH=128 /DNA_ID=CAMNT_0021907415 /DNA_START=1234 /DNA_END=1620 /DNA_ORIENTATION=+
MSAAAVDLDSRPAPRLMSAHPCSKQLARLTSRGARAEEHSARSRRIKAERPLVILAPRAVQTPGFTELWIRTQINEDTFEIAFPLYHDGLASVMSRDEYTAWVHDVHAKIAPHQVSAKALVCTGAMMI